MPRVIRVSNAKVSIVNPATGEEVTVPCVQASAEVEEDTNPPAEPDHAPVPEAGMIEGRLTWIDPFLLALPPANPKTN